jgi:hypothetical protein
MTVLNGGILIIMRIAIWLRSNASQNKDVSVPREKSDAVGFSLVERYNALWVFFNLAPMAALIYVSG